MKKKSKPEYNYRYFSLLLDKDEPEDQEIIDWLKKHKTKRNNYSAQIKKALRKVMEEG